jgi:homoserine dehydrogenase
VLRAASFFSDARGAENRMEIELKSGEVIRLRGQGAGRWPTAVSVVGDLHEIARLAESAPMIDSIAANNLQVANFPVAPSIW